MANDFPKIFSEGWERFKSAVPSYDKPYYNKQAEAVLQCGDPVFGFRNISALTVAKIAVLSLIPARANSI